MQLAADTLPEVLVTHEFSVAAQTALIESGKIYNFTEDEIRKNMPLYTKRVEDLGLDLPTYIGSNQWSDGKLYFVPYELREVAFPKLRKDIRAIRNAADSPYSFYFRDDILKMIYPNARSEYELKELFIANGGKLTIDDIIGDIPIYNMDDLHGYLKKVKDLGLKVGDKDVIPAQLTVSSNVGSTLWSLQTAMQIFWQDGFSFKDDQLMHVQSSDVFKEYIRYYSTFNAEGLIDREAWIMKDDQIRAKAINGEFAVFNYWLPVNDARQLSKDEGRGYGYRLLPAFTVDLVNEYQNMTNRPINLTTATKIIISKTVKEANKAQVFGWIDWNMSYEADDLRNWGLPEWSEGEGVNRRFKPEYKAIEDSLLLGVHSDQDAGYYGLRSNASNFFNPETHKLIMSGNFTKPTDVYPIPVSLDMNIDDKCFEAIREYYGTQMTFYNQIGWTISEDLGNDELWKIASDKASTPEHDSRLAAAMVASPEDFDAKYDEYYDNAYPAEFQAALTHLKEKWRDIYNTKVAPEIEKAKSLK
jgi:ABC-type glycerol-3-phosphate transport system substrate-binding protein